MIDRQYQKAQKNETALSSMPTNAELVQRRLQVAQEKRLARERSVQQRTQRNLHIKRLLLKQEEGDNKENKELQSQLPPLLYAVKVTVSENLRKELQLSGREKRGRVFVERGSDAVTSYKALTLELHNFFRALRKNTFVLRASVPQIDNDDGTINVADSSSSSSWPITSDEDVKQMFAKADEIYDNATKTPNLKIKRPSIVLHVERDPNAPQWPPPPPPYLENMDNPSDTTTMTMLSFYSFPPSGGITDPDDFALRLKKLWKPFGALGRVYVAYEGVNAQMSVPTNVLPNFIDCCYNYIPELGQYMENGINIDPKPLTIDEFNRAGVSVVNSTLR